MEGKKDEESVNDDEPQPEVVNKQSSKPTVSKSGAGLQPAPSKSGPVVQPTPSKSGPVVQPASSKSGPVVQVPSGIAPEGAVSEEHLSQAETIEASAAHDSPSEKKPDIPSSKSKVISEGSRSLQIIDKQKNTPEEEDVPTADAGHKKKPPHRSDGPLGIVTCLTGGLPNFENFSCSKFFTKRSPFVHNPPQPEERRPRIDRPRCPRDYIINLREDLADFQESHGLPRTRDYSFMSLGLALAQETARAICSVFLMFTELFPVVAIISLVLRFSLDKLIDILETSDPIAKMKKTLIFCLQLIMILIPLWILIGTIVLPLAGLLLSIFRKLLRFKGGKSGRVSCGQPKKHGSPSGFKKIESTKRKPTSCAGPSKESKP